MKDEKDVLHSSFMLHPSSFRREGGTMKPKTMMLMVVAIGCGLVASYMTSKLLAERSATAAEEAKVKILVAKARVPAWLLIKEPEKYFEEKEIPESVAPKKALRELTKIKDQRLVQPLSEGEYLLEDKVVNVEQAGLIAKLPPGMRAVAIRVNAESLAGGFVLPGYRVDVVSTTRGQPHESSARIILQNMLVLAVDTISNRDTQTNSILGSTVTLAAMPEEAQRLSLAAALGELRLTLRTPDDNKIVRLPSAKLDDLGKPTHDSSAAKEEELAQLTYVPPVPPLPPLPKDAPPPMTLVEKTPEKAPEPPPPPPETHTMTIVESGYARKAVFTRDPNEKVWTNGSLNGGAAEAPRRRTPPPTSPAPAEKEGARGHIQFETAQE
jgi:pilus assembly protein CpaB